MYDYIAELNLPAFARHLGIGSPPFDNQQALPGAFSADGRKIHVPTVQQTYFFSK